MNKIKIFLFWFFSLQAQVTLEGIENIAPNQLKLCWSISGTSNNFHAYYIFLSNDGISFSIIDSVMNQSQSFYIYNSPTSITSPLFFYIGRGDTVGNSIQIVQISDTLQSIYLYINSLNENNVVLKWNKPRDFPLSSQSPFYEVWRSVLGGPFALIGVKPWTETNFSDTLKICQGNVKYYIKVNSTNNCPSISNTLNFTFQDAYPPGIPVIDSVSITSGGTLAIGWQKPPNYDVYGYYILIENSNGWTVVDTIYNAFTTFYDYGIVPYGAMRVGVSAFDSCIGPNGYNVSAMSNPHKSIFLNLYFDSCSREISLMWNKYEGWSVAFYEVYINTNNAGFNKIASLPGNSTSYKIKIDSSGNYCFFVRALGQYATSSSNRVCQNIPSVTSPELIYIISASYEDTTYISFNLFVKNPLKSFTYQVEHSSLGGTWNLLKTIPEISTNTTKIVLPYTPTPDKLFRIVALNSCGNIVKISNVVRPIYLMRDTSSAFPQIVLKWNKYSGCEYAGGSVNHYEVFRQKDNSFSIISNTPFTNFSDDIFKAIIQDKFPYNNICYYVEAKMNPDTLGYSDVARSNTLCINLEPIIWIPNAFTPNDDEINDIFSIKSIFLDSQDVEMYILNRFGRIIFYSPELAEWDGRNAPEGVYVLILYSKKHNFKIYREILVIK